MKTSGFVAIIGKPNVGKSTLLNTILGEKIAIVSKKPQTTRTKITGIYTKDEVQYVFIDTPGFHKARTKLGDFMVKSAVSAIGDVNCILFIAEVGEEPNKAEHELIAKLKKQDIPVILLINKCDTAGKDKIAAALMQYSALYDFTDVIPISALNGDGVDTIFESIKPYMTEPRWFFPEDAITDQPERQIAAEVIREKMLRLLDEEIPHGTAVVIEEFKDKKELISIRAEIFCEKASHKGIIIGKGGETLKKIGTYAREDLERFFGMKVYLNLWVKVKENWRDNALNLTNFGFYDE